MESTKQIGIIVSAREGGGFSVLDALGRQHYAHDEVELGLLLSRLCRDDELPQYQSDGAAAAALEQATIHIVSEKVPDYLKPIAPMLGHAAASAATNGVKRGLDWLSGMAERRREKKAEERAQAKHRSPRPPSTKPKKSEPPVAEPAEPQPPPPLAPAPRPKRARVAGSSLRFRDAGGKG